MNSSHLIASWKHLCAISSRCTSVEYRLCGLCRFMTNGEVLHYTLSWAGEQICFIHNLVDSNRLLRLGNWSRYYHTGPRHGARTGRNKLCIKALVSFSPGQTYMGYNVTLPKATINSWLHGIQNVYFLLSWNTMTSPSEIQLYPFAHIWITVYLCLRRVHVYMSRKYWQFEGNSLLADHYNTWNVTDFLLPLLWAVGFIHTLTPSHSNKSDHSKFQILHVRTNSCNILLLRPSSVKNAPSHLKTLSSHSNS